MKIMELMPQVQGAANIPTAKPAGEVPTAPTAAVSDPSSVDSNNDGVITPDELFRHFDADGDGKIDIVDYAAHILYHLIHPEALQPYMTQALSKLDQYNCSGLSERLVGEQLLISKADTNVDTKAKDALKRGEDVNLVDPNDIGQLKLKENFMKLAGIIR